MQKIEKLMASAPEPQTRVECDHPRFSDVWGSFVRDSWLHQLKQHRHPDREWFNFCPECGKKLSPPAPKPSPPQPPEAL